MNAGSENLFSELLSSISESFSSFSSCTLFLHAALIKTKLGDMFAISHEEQLCFLQFIDTQNIRKKIWCLCCKLQANLTQDKTPALTSVATELNSYYNGTLKNFTTQFCLVGTPFVKTVWRELNRIPYGQTCSYKKIAQNISKQNAYRAVANANADNPIAIIVPCHRVIRSDGSIGGYNGGIDRKQLLITHESSISIERPVDLS